MLPYLAKTIQDTILPDPIILGKGVTFWAFFVFLLGTLINNYKNFIGSLYHRILFIFFVFILCAFFIESTHSGSSYESIATMFFMCAAIPLYASWILRNKVAFNYIIISFIIYAFVNAVNVAANISIFQMFAFGDSDEARETIAKKLWFYTNLNEIAYTAGTAMVVCYLSARNTVVNKTQKYWLYALMVLFMYVWIVCFSRSAYLNIVFIVVMFYLKYRPGIKPQYAMLILLASMILSISAVQKVNDFILSRFATIEIGNTKSTDSRSKLYTKVLQHIPEVYVTGVGDGGFHGSWGLKTDMTKLSYSTDRKKILKTKVEETHNSITQILFYWGFFPVIIYFLAQIRMIKMLPDKKYLSWESKIANVIFFSTFSLIMFTNNFNYKEFTLAYGLLLGLYLRRKYKLSS